MIICLGTYSILLITQLFVTVYNKEIHMCILVVTDIFLATELRRATVYAHFLSNLWI